MEIRYTSAKNNLELVFKGTAEELTPIVSSLINNSSDFVQVTPVKNRKNNEKLHSSSPEYVNIRTNALADLKSGMGVTAVSKKYNVTPNTIRNWVKKYDTTSKSTTPTNPTAVRQALETISLA